MEAIHEPITSSITALLGATLIDGTGRAPVPGAVVLIERDRIVAAGPRSAVAVPAGAQVLDFRGKYVMPGMMDANVHLILLAAAELIRYEGRYEDLIAEAAQIALKNGLTTVFDTWGPREALTHVRDGINRGELMGSRIFFAGNIIGLGGPTSTDFSTIARSVLSKREADMIDARWEQGVGSELLWMTPEEVRVRVRTYIENGDQDFLKYASSGHGESQMQFICFSEEIQRIIVEEGHRAGMTVQAHATSPESLRMEIEAGADLLQHGDITGLKPMPAETVALINQRKIPVAALFVTRRYLEWNNAQPESMWKTAQQIKDGNDCRLIAANAPILLTTDAFVLPADAAEPVMAAFVSANDSPVALGEAHFYWLEAAAELGMKPMDALMAATKNPAHAYGKGADLGTLEPGKKADLLVLDADPLADSKNYRRIERVMKDGKFVDRDHLPDPHVLTKP